MSGYCPSEDVQLLFQDRQTVMYFFKESHVLELSYVRVLIDCNNITEIITVWWNDAYLSIAFLHSDARFTKLLCESRSAKQLSEGPGLHYVLQTLFWFVMQQHKNKPNYNLRSTSEILLQQPRIKTLLMLGDRGYTVATRALRNNLPNAIRSATNTHLFKIAFDLEIV